MTTLNVSQYLTTESTAEHRGLPPIQGGGSLGHETDPKKKKPFDRPHPEYEHRSDNDLR